MTSEIIDEAVKGLPQAKRTAVANFVLSCDPKDHMANSMNLAMDARAYKWNASTVKAIRTGIALRNGND